MKQTKRGTNKCKKQTNTALPPMSERWPVSQGPRWEFKKKAKNKQTNKHKTNKKRNKQMQQTNKHILASYVREFVSHSGTKVET